MAVQGDADFGDETEGIDLSVAVFREDGDWVLADLDPDRCGSVSAVAAELRRYPADGDVLGMVSVDEDFFLLVRTRGQQFSVLLSDASAAADWELARTATQHLGVTVVDDDEAVPAGDLGIVADLGLPADEMGELLDDEELFPDEQLSEIADALGFGEDFDELAELDEE